MNWVDEALEQFGKHMGIDRLRFNDNGLCGLDMENGSALYLETKEDHFYIYFAKTIEYIDDNKLARALSAAHFTNGLRAPLAAGLKDGNKLVFFTWMPLQDVTPPSMEEAVKWVMSAHEGM